MGHTKGTWTIYDDGDSDDNSDIVMAWIDDDEGGRNDDIAAMMMDRPASERKANARLIASAPAMLEAIETAGRIVGQVLDNPRMSADARAYALSRASDALRGTYFRTTGSPLEWWQPEPAIAKATEEVRP